MFSIEHVPIEMMYHLNNGWHKGYYIPTNRIKMKIGQKTMWSNMHLHIFCCLKFFHTFEINLLNEINAFIDPAVVFYMWLLYPRKQSLGGYIGFTLSVRPHRGYMVCPRNSSYSFSARKFLFCRSFVHISKMCMW